MDGIIWETENMSLVAHKKPHVSREEGGHIKIVLKNPISDRTKVDPKIAIEVMRLSMVAGEAMTLVMEKNGIKLERINYQDNGNWAPMFGRDNVMHVHLYGRTGAEKIQKRYPSALYFPDPSNEEYYKDFKPITDEDCESIRVEMERIFKEDKYQDKEWHL